MKLHVSMRVGDIDSAIGFYSALFGQDPVIVRGDYAKWDVADPAVNFVVQGGNPEGGLDHVGIEVESPEQLETVAGRLRGAGRPFLDVEAGTCCYARSDKAWIKGDAGEKWEAFLTHSHDEEEYGTGRAHLLDDVIAGAETGCCGKPKAEACC